MVRKLVLTSEIVSPEVVVWILLRFGEEFESRIVMPEDCSVIEFVPPLPLKLTVLLPFFKPRTV
jgi:hypothetical protein